MSRPPKSAAPAGGRHPVTPPRPVITAGLLLETSVGSLTVDLFGADCPALSGNFLNLCRAQFWNGAVATEVIPGVAAFFSLAADSVYHALLQQALRQREWHRAASGAGSESRPLVHSFWSLLAQPENAQDEEATVEVQLAPSSRTGTATNPIQQQDEALQHAAQQEIRLGKRRRCTGLALTAGSYRSVFAAAAPNHAHSSPTSTAAVLSPCTVHRAGSLILDVTNPSLRFGLTLTDRTMDFLDAQYVVIGSVAEGEAVLKRLQRAPLHERTGIPSSVLSRQEDVVAGRPASAWPRPVRMIRVKRAVVLPTAGTEKFVSSVSSDTVLSTRQRQQVGEALHGAGCFRFWAPATAVRAAQRRLIEILQAALRVRSYAAPTPPQTAAEAAAYLHTGPVAASPSASSSKQHTEPFIVPLPSHPPSAEPVTITYNPHYSGDYLSSEDENDEESTGLSSFTAGARSLSAKQLEERRKTFMQQHQEKASKTLSLMLNVLNGVADVRGDIKPPENVLFVCKLNPVTTGEGLALCFAQFGHVVSADVVYDGKTKQSLCYGFVEFETVEACFRAFQKMDRALIDDCRIHVDFSQSVSKLWAQRQREMRKRDRP